MKMDCLVCGAEFVLDGWNICPHCGAVGDELMEVNEDEGEEPSPAYDFTAERYLVKACTECGLENKHTIAIGKLVDAKKAGYLDAEYADYMARIIYLHADEELQYPFADEEEEDAYFDEGDEMGFDPYMGCYTGDC